MKYRTLGKTGLKVSEVGYGTWQFANDDECWVGATKEESEKSLLTAIDNGLNFIDTARSYGDGLAEKWIGEFIKKRPDKDIIIASKILPMNWQWPARAGTPIEEVFPAKHIISQVEESLRDLNIESLDLMYFHVWQDEWATKEEWQETVEKLTKQGKVKHWGISTNNYESTNCIEACKTGHISVVQAIFNLFAQEPIDSLFPYAKENNIGIVARVPLDEGGLTGNLNSATKFEEGDFRSSYFTPERLIELEQRISNLNDIVVSNQDIKSVAELALRYILSFDEISSVIPGMRKQNHVIENTNISNKQPLSSSLLKQLKEHAWNRNFYGNNSWE